MRFTKSESEPPVVNVCEWTINIDIKMDPWFIWLSDQRANDRSNEAPYQRERRLVPEQKEQPHVQQELSQPNMYFINVIII